MHHLPKKQYEIQVFSRIYALFLPKNRKVMGFSGSVNGITKNPGFFILVFANVNGPNVPRLEGRMEGSAHPRRWVS